MAAGLLDLKVEQGIDFSRVFTVTDADNDPVNLTGHSVYFQVRGAYGEESILAVSSKVPSPYTAVTGLTISFTDAAHGEFTLAISGACSQTVNPGPYRYEILLVRTSGDRRVRLLEGHINFSPGETP